ncbi:TPA: hypothetical protein HA265_00075 [Candidatus Woesearchaeota archaeon]|nr:hypothetical protein [Candidatus Woesearchaeota archaeon]
MGKLYQHFINKGPYYIIGLFALAGLATGTSRILSQYESTKRATKVCAVRIDHPKEDEYCKNPCFRKEVNRAQPNTYKKSQLDDLVRSCEN